jgi:hypothetical protein
VLPCTDDKLINCEVTLAVIVPLQDSIFFEFIAKKKISLLQGHASMEGEEHPATNRKLVYIPVYR